MDAKKCDACGCYYTEDVIKKRTKKGSSVPVKLRYINILGSNVVNNVNLEYDLCNYCMDKVLKLVGFETDADCVKE